MPLELYVQGDHAMESLGAHLLVDQAAGGILEIVPVVEVEALLQVAVRGLGGLARRLGLRLGLPGARERHDQRNGH